MPEDTAVVSGATEAAPATPAAEPSSTSTQTGAETATPASTSPAEQPATPAQKKRLRELLKDDPDLAAEYHADVQRQNARAQKRWERQQLRADARAAVEADDAEAAVAIAKHVADSPDDDDDGPDHTAQAKKWATLNADKAFLADPDYAEVYRSEGGKELVSKLFREAKDIDAFKAAIRKEGRDLAISRSVREAIEKSLPAIRAAAKTDAENTTLKNLPVPPAGDAGGAGGLTLDAYNSDPALRRKLASTPEGRKQIDDMMARAARG